MRLDLDPTKVVRYPRNMTLGALSDEKLIYQLGYEIGTQCAVLGIHINFAPVADVNNNPENPVIHDRSFGDNPKRVARLALLFTQGLHDAGILACAKHFPGHGDTNVDSHLALPKISHSRERLNTVELIPFNQRYCILVCLGLQCICLWTSNITLWIDFFICVLFFKSPLFCLQYF
jgi:beta-N-acetylhexosaminidase